MHKLLALQLPGFGDNSTIKSSDISNNFKTTFTDLGSLVGGFLNLLFFVVGFLMLYNLVLGAFRYLSAGDNKEIVAKARQRITWAIVGFLVVILAFSAAQSAKALLPINQVPLTNVTSPSLPKEFGQPKQQPGSEPLNPAPASRDCAAFNGPDKISECIGAGCLSISCSSKKEGLKCVESTLTYEEACP